MTNDEIKDYLDSLQIETEASLWGNKVKFKPYLLEEVFGDGMKLIYFGTLDDRPYWWLVRVDGSIEDMDDVPYEEIHQAIEEECGCIDEYDENYDEENQNPYPAITKWTSPHWGLVADLNKGVDRYGIPLKPKTKQH